MARRDGAPGARADPGGDAPVAWVLCDLGEQGNRLVEAAPRVRRAGIPPHPVPGVRMVVVRSGVRVDGTLCDRFPDLRVVCRAGSGSDNLDLDELHRRGVEVVRNPDASAAAVAETAHVGLAALARRLPEAHAATLAQEWRKPDLVGEPLDDLRVAVWGAGPVGQACGHRFTSVCAAVRYAAHRSVPAELPRAAPGELGDWADVHVVALPHRPATEALFDGTWARAVRSLRPYVVVVGRLAVCDVGDLVAACWAGDLRGVFVDPVDRRDLPDVAAALRASGPANVLVSQHLGAQRHDVLLTLARWVLRRVGELVLA